MTNTENDPRVDGRLRYRVLTVPDTADFCERVSQALADGYVLSGSPAITERGGEIIVAQAIILPDGYSGTDSAPRTGFAAR